MEPSTMITAAALATRIASAVASEVSGAWSRLSDKERAAVQELAQDAAKVVLARVKNTWPEQKFQREWAQVVAQVQSVTAIVGNVIADSFVAVVEQQIKDLSKK